VWVRVLHGDALSVPIETINVVLLAVIETLAGKVLRGAGQFGWQWLGYYLLFIKRVKEMPIGC